MTKGKAIALTAGGFMVTWIILSYGAVLGLAGGIIALACGIAVMGLGIYKLLDIKLLTRKEKRRETRDKKVAK